MMQDKNIEAIYNIVKIIDEAKESKEDEEYIKDFCIIDNMINGTIPYVQSEVDKIKLKYYKEFNYLLNLEINTFPSQRTNIKNTEKQDLMNVRHSLIRVGVQRTLKKIGKQMLEQQLIDNNNINLYNNFLRLYFGDVGKEIELSKGYTDLDEMWKDLDKED